MWSLFNFAVQILLCIPAFFRGRKEQAIVELALRQQLATYAEGQRRPKLTSLDCEKMLD